MRFAAVQFDIIWEDKAANHAVIERMLTEAKVPAGTFVLLPELGDTGFSMNLNKIVDEQTLEWGRKLARAKAIYLQVGYAELGPDQRGRNCAAIIAPNGSIAGVYRKIHPFSYGKEALHYSGGETALTTRCESLSVTPMICYDLRFPELWRLAAIATPSTEVFTIGASWPAARQQHWRSLLIARAIENQAYVVAVNRTGSDPHLRYAGGSIIISPKGDILAEGADHPQVLCGEIDPAAVGEWRKEFPALKDVKRGLLGSIELSV